MISTAPTVVADPKSESEMLKSISDPTAFAARLKALTNKSVEAASFLEQAKAENQKVEEGKRQAEAIHADTMEMLRQHVAKEEEIKQREDALQEREQAVSSNEISFLDRKTAFEKEVSEARTVLAKGQTALGQAQQVFASKIDQQEEYIKAEVSRRTAAIEAQCQKRLNELDALAEDLAVRSKQAEEKSVAADQQKAAFEAKASQLKSLIS